MKRLRTYRYDVLKRPFLHSERTFQVLSQVGDDKRTIRLECLTTNREKAEQIVAALNMASVVASDAVPPVLSKTIIQQCLDVLWKFGHRTLADHNDVQRFIGVIGNILPRHPDDPS